MLRRIGLAIAVLGVVGAGGVGLHWLRLQFPHVTGAEPIPHTDLNPHGANFFLDRAMEPWKIEKTLDMAQEAGVGWIKQQFSWEEIEPLRKGEFDWARYDRIIELAGPRGMQVIARLDRPPAWARREGQFETHLPRELADYGDYVYAVVQRYSGRVRYVQL